LNLFSFLRKYQIKQINTRHQKIIIDSVQSDKCATVNGANGVAQLATANGANRLASWQMLMVQMELHKFEIVDCANRLASWQQLMVQMDWQVGNS